MGLTVIDVNFFCDIHFIFTLFFFYCFLASS